ncbi:leucyl aminopeptidase family protein [Aliidiomarina taiwanensis]|nr:leucyl aminopeptidase family protein [Aliidiomarina taiwanensis]
MHLPKSIKTITLAAMLGLFNPLMGCASAHVEANFVESYLSTQTQLVTNFNELGDTLVVVVPEGAQVKLAGWSNDTANHVQRVMDIAKFEGKVGQTHTIVAPLGLTVDRLILVGVGNPADAARHKVEEAGASLAAMFNSLSAETVSIDGSLIENSNDNSRILAQLSHGIDLRNYRFDRFKSDPAPRPSQNMRFLVSDRSQASKEFADYRALAEGVFLARELTNLPGSNGYPAAFAEYARQAFESLDVEVTILGPEEVKAMGMGALYGVSQGSQHQAHLLVAHYKGNNDQPIALVGKGITFDTGGYNIKTDSSSMRRMHTDKAGAAAVIGSVLTLASQKADVNVVAVAPLAHNMVSDKAQLPGDVVTTGSGLTIEVGHTDAEGRLVLSDGLWYAREHFQPRVMADIATLTGAKIRAIGNDFSAVFSDHEEVYESLRAAAEATNERVWRLPLDPVFESAIESRIADVINTGSPGASAGAMLLQRFVGDTPWIHIDMAGNALVGSDKGIHPRGSTGYGVRMLTEWAKSNPLK